MRHALTMDAHRRGTGAAPSAAPSVTSSTASCAVATTRMLRTVLLIGSVAVGLLASAFADATAIAATDPQLVLLLRGMALIKASLVLAACAAVCWRFGWRVSRPFAAGYIAGVWCFVAATVLIWFMSALALAAVIFHAGLFGLLLLALNDGRAGCRAAIPGIIRRFQGLPMKERDLAGPALMLKSALVAGLAAAGSAFAASSVDEAVLNCRAQTDLAQRLACYDGIALPTARDAARAGAAVPAAAANPPLPPAAAFGLENRRQPDAVDELSSQLSGRFEGWGPGTRFTLANGQVWEVSDGSFGIYSLQSPKVTVRRALLGTFRLEIDGAGKSPRVKRVE